MATSRYRDATLKAMNTNPTAASRVIPATSDQTVFAVSWSVRLL
ncbi:hypothetical protein BN903_224 [Halorubrum sp. AJ67]|nr:hypothetical protein BN903_224 [Halorubrum sp. AJ67]